MQIKVKTTTGETTIETTHIAAITKKVVVEAKPPSFYQTYRYILDIHMTSGTIFNAELEGNEMKHLYWAWSTVNCQFLPQEDE
jgi:hypothetical protein